MKQNCQIDLFAGIGGFSVAGEAAGYSTDVWVEQADFGQKVLSHYYPESDRYSDIRYTDFTKYRGKVALLTGGFPCQPFSVAGKQRGPEDERNLWPEMLRAVRECRPARVVAENVNRLVTWGGGHFFDSLISDLENENYEVQFFIIPASGVDAPHLRYRVWIVAQRKDEIPAAPDFTEAETLPGQATGAWPGKNGKACADFFGRLPHVSEWRKNYVREVLTDPAWRSELYNLHWEIRSTPAKRVYFELSARQIKNRAKGLKTPTAFDAELLGSKKRSDGYGSGGLAQEVMTGFIYTREVVPTPRANSVQPQLSETLAARKKGNIEEYAARKLFPIPMANDAEQSSLPEGEVRMYLNPRFGLEIMGYPAERLSEPFDNKLKAQTTNRPFQITEHPAASEFDRVPTGQDAIEWRKLAIKATGNAIVPQIPEILIKKLNKYKWKI